MKEDVEFNELNLEQMEANKESDRVSRLIDTWGTKIRECDATLQVVEQARIKLSKELVEMNQRKKDLESAISKAEHTLRQHKSEAKQLERLYWRCK